jgi:succinate dehydrogenase / fumarate reductase flavoprotein subunit
MKLGKIMWDKCGMSRDADGLKTAISEIGELRAQYWKDVRVLGNVESFNQSLEKAGRVADFMEFAEVMCYDALTRDESCGAHLRVEHTDAEGEAKRDDENFAFVSVWEFKGVGEEPALHKEPLAFEYVPLSTRSYK